MKIVPYVIAFLIGWSPILLMKKENPLPTHTIFVKSATQPPPFSWQDAKTGVKLGKTHTHP
jgi:hypothetical protein